MSFHPQVANLTASGFRGPHYPCVQRHHRLFEWEGALKGRLAHLELALLRWLKHRLRQHLFCDLGENGGLETAESTTISYLTPLDASTLSWSATSTEQTTTTIPKLTFAVFLASNVERFVAKSRLLKPSLWNSAERSAPAISRTATI